MNTEMLTKSKIRLSQHLLTSVFLVTTATVFFFTAYLAVVPFPEAERKPAVPVVTLTQPAFVTSLPKDLEFAKVTIDGQDIYYHLRQVGDIRIEKDILVYRHDSERNRYVEVRKRWRDDVPSMWPEIISKVVAENIVLKKISGKVKFSNLILVSTDTFIYNTIKPLPANPIWSVSIDADSGGRHIAVVDAVTEDYLGEGLPPPVNESISTVGKNLSIGVCAIPANWSDLAAIAYYAFQDMGYNPLYPTAPDNSELQTYISSPDTAVFSEVGHGGSYGITLSCSGFPAEYVWTYPDQVDSWIDSTGGHPIPFTFMLSCDAMCDSGPGTFSYAFRQGQNINTTVVGLCNGGDEICNGCYENNYPMVNDFFDELVSGKTVDEAFNYAMINNPECSGCFGYDGDPDLKLVPKVYREQDVPPGGEINCGMSLMPGGSYTLDHDLDCYEMNGLYLPSEVTLDCAGHYIDGHDSDGFHSGITFIGDYSIVKNCNIRHFEYGFFVNGSTEWNQMQYNVLEANTVGIRAGYDTTYTGIHNNELYGNGIGISLGGNNSSVYGNAACNSQSLDLTCGLDVIGNVGNQNYFNQVNNFCNDQTGLYWNYCNGGINMFEECQKNPMNGKCLQLATPPPM